MHKKENVHSGQRHHCFIHVEDSRISNRTAVWLYAKEIQLNILFSTINSLTKGLILRFVFVILE